MRVGINGMGRIGRLGPARRHGRHRSRLPTIRARGNRLEVVHVNELKGGAGMTAHLLEFDSIHGRWRQKHSACEERQRHP